VYLVTDRHQSCDRDLVEVVARALQGGIRSVQLREKDLDALQLFRLGQRLMQVCREAGSALLVNDRVDVAKALDADGVHLSNGSLPATEARKLLGPAKLIGVSCHSIEQIRNAVAGGCDFVVLGPVFATPSKARYGPPLTPAVIREARTLSSMPILAIGGIQAHRVREVVAAGADGIAVISAVLTAADPAAAASELLSAVNTRVL
jgi:thiamine-phosphate pyrophosphorylase